MALLDIWDYVRAMGDRRLRQQGYVASGMGILERYRRVPAFWAPHLEKNRQNILEISKQLKEKGGTLLILGAGRLLDVPWEQLFPLFDRVVLVDADHCIVPYVERLLGGARIAGIPKPIFEIADLTASVVDVAAWAESTIRAAASPAAAGKALVEGFERSGAAQPPWARAYADVRLAISTNLVSQLGYFPRLYIQTEFRKRFNKPFGEQEAAAEGLECYFDRVRARHILDLAALKKAWVYLSTDIQTQVYEMEASAAATLQKIPPPSNAGLELADNLEVKFAWPVEVIERSDPLHGQKMKELWPRGTQLDSPRRWVWHIVPQGSEKKYTASGRVHLVEAWTKRPG